MSLDESIEFFRTQFKLPKDQLGNAKLEKSINKLAEQLQGYPLGLQLAAGNINYMLNDDSIGPLDSKVEEFNGSLSGGIDPYLTNQPPFTPTDCPYSFQAVWILTMEKLRKERCSARALHLLQILAYADHDGVLAKTLRVVYETF